LLSLPQKSKIILIIVSIFRGEYTLTYNKPVLCNYFNHLQDYNIVYKTNLLKLYKDKYSLIEEIYKLHLKKTNIVEPKWSGLEWKDFAKGLIQEINE